jgi:hypothetical protein
MIIRSSGRHNYPFQAAIFVVGWLVFLASSLPFANGTLLLVEYTFTRNARQNKKWQFNRLLLSSNIKEARLQRTIVLAA